VLGERHDRDQGQDDQAHGQADAGRGPGGQPPVIACAAGEAGDGQHGEQHERAGVEDLGRPDGAHRHHGDGGDHRGGQRGDTDIAVRQQPGQYREGDEGQEREDQHQRFHTWKPRNCGPARHQPAGG
jgi:hypothetical protein